MGSSRTTLNGLKTKDDALTINVPHLKLQSSYSYNDHVMQTQETERQSIIWKTIFNKLINSKDSYRLIVENCFLCSRFEVNVHTHMGVQTDDRA